MQSEIYTKEGIFKGKKTLAIMPTFTCPASCTNCGTLSNPDEKTNLPIEKIIGAIREAKKLGFYNVVFTGGEVTLRWDDLLCAISESTRLGFPTRIVTNAHWALSLSDAKKKIQELVDSGLSEINYSTGDEHTRFIPLDRVIYATIAAIEKSLPVHIMIELVKKRSIIKNSIMKNPLITNLSKDKRDCIKIVESPWMPLSPDQIEEYPESVTTNRLNLSARSGCDNILQTYTVQADGKIGACCGLGLRLISELNVGTTNDDHVLRHAVEEAESDLLKLWIHYKGPEKILAWAAEKNPNIKWEHMYAHHCQACQRIYHDQQVIDVIKKYYTEIIGEILQCVWIDEEYFPEKINRQKNLSHDFFSPT